MPEALLMCKNDNNNSFSSLPCTQAHVITGEGLKGAHPSNQFSSCTFLTDFTLPLISRDKVDFRLGSPSPVSERADTRRSWSPEKLPLSPEKSSRSEMTLSEAGAGSGLDFPHHSHSASVIVGLADKKSDSMSDSTSEKDGARTLSTSRHSRERSFERSLENILDKCSEKSLDLNLSVDSWNGAMSEGGSRSLDQMPLSAAKGTKGDKRKKAAWYTVSRLSIFTFCIASGQCIVR